MKDTQALKVLQDILRKYLFTQQEKMAIRSAIGILGWTSLAESKIRELGKRKREKDARDATWNASTKNKRYG